MDTIALCLGYCKDWNTNARKSVVVHALVGSILRCVSISSLKDIPVRGVRQADDGVRNSSVYYFLIFVENAGTLFRWRRHYRYLLKCCVFVGRR